MTVQLLALSLRKSVATAARSGLPGMCEMRLAERADLLRLTVLLFLLTQASVATWKMSRTLFSDCSAEHSMYGAEICLAIAEPWRRRRYV